MDLDYISLWELIYLKWKIDMIIWGKVWIWLVAIVVVGTIFMYLTDHIYIYKKQKELKSFKKC